MKFLLFICFTTLHKTCLSQSCIRVFVYESRENKTNGQSPVYLQERLRLEVEPNKVNNETITIEHADLSPIFGSSTPLAAGLDESCYDSLNPVIKAKIMTTFTYEGQMRAAIIMFEYGTKYYHVQLRTLNGPKKPTITKSILGGTKLTPSNHTVIFNYFDSMENPKSLKVSLVDGTKAAIAKDDKADINDMFYKNGQIQSVKGIRGILEDRKNRRISPQHSSEPLIYLLPLPELYKTKQNITYILPGSAKATDGEVIQIAIGGEGVLVGDGENKNGKIPKLKTVYADKNFVGVMIDGWED